MSTYKKILELARQAEALGQELVEQHEWDALEQLRIAVRQLKVAATTRQAEIDKLEQVWFDA